MSFETPLQSVCSSTPNGLLILPLSGDGLLYTDDMDTPMDHGTRLMLHLLVLTWLISLAAGGGEEDHSLWTPFTVTGLQQTILDGGPCVIVTIGMVIMSN